MERVLLDIAQTYGLEHIETTQDRGGYPRYIKDAIIGFNTFSEAQELADRYGLRVQYFEKKAGWQLWYRTGNMAYEEYDYEQVWRNGLNADIEVFKSGEEEEVIEQLKFLLGACENLSSMRCFIDDCECVLNQLSECSPDEFVVTNGGEYDGTYPCSCMSYSYDTRHYAIGIAE